MENNRSKENEPRYIEVYNKILKNIKDGLYNEANKLPGENKLAQQMGVSRITLRQSLMLLQEDGIIESRKGVGNFLHSTLSQPSIGLEQLGSVIEKCGINDFDRMTCTPVLGMSNLYSDEVFERKVPIVLGTNMYYYGGEHCYAHCFSILATDIDIIQDYDLLDALQVSELLTKKIYTLSKTVKFEIKIMEDHDKLINDVFEDEHQLFVLVIEKIIDHQGRVICLNKYHIPTQYANIKINAF